MSILIRGMNMPKAGELLQVAENVDGTIFVRETAHEEWHQVIVVPTPHGRLLNLRDIAELACRTKDKMTLRQLSDLPTVIEAEE